jgi:CubicO group peptidase (beta-lactamase class C family)
MMKTGLSPIKKFDLVFSKFTDNSSEMRYKFKKTFKKYHLYIFFAIFILNQNIARVEGPFTEHVLLNHIEQVISQKKASVIDSFFQARFQKRAFNGTVLFAEKGRVIYENALGFSDFKQKDILDVNSIFQLASVTKPITACAVLMLYEEGKLNLDDEISEFFPAFPYDGVTVRMLLTHRSGLPDYMYFADKLWHSRRIPISNQDVLDLMILYKPYRYYKPDRRYNYSNTNYALLALIIEKVSGMSYAEFMQARIFEPLGMKDSYVVTFDDLKSYKKSPFVPGYYRPGRLAENHYFNGVVGDKGIYSTVNDLFLWDQALYQGRLISLFTLREAFQPAHRDLRDYDNYGFGWRLNLAGENRIVFHSGWWKGFKTYFIRKIDEQKTIIILTNTANHHFISIRKLSELL